MTDGEVEVLHAEPLQDGRAWVRFRRFGVEHEGVWTRGKAVHTRRVRTCAVSGVPVRSGMLVWRPLESASYREVRITDDALSGAFIEAAQ